MSESVPTEYDPIWETDIYSQGQALNRYPFDLVVSFVYRHYPRNKACGNVKILEIGCGAGNNLWFAAREGFSVTGIDGSASAIEFACKRFAADGLKGDFHVGDFINLPFQDNSFDIVIDRAALTCSGATAARSTIQEVRRVLLPEGKFYFNPYSDRHASFSAGKPGPDGLRVDINGGTLVGIGPLYFYSKREMFDIFNENTGWKMLSIRHIEWSEELQPKVDIHAEWIVIAQKV